MRPLRFVSLSGAKLEVREEVRRLAGPLAEEAGYELVDVEHAFQGRHRIVRVLLDKPGGINVGGPQSQTSAPSFVKSSTLERRTRLCSRSPRMATFSPFNVPLCRRIVNASSRACVGCSCMPSPALMIRERQTRASR